MGHVPAVRCEVEPIGTRLLVSVSGDLTVASAPRVRSMLLKCLVDQPDVVVVDLTGIVVREPSAVAVFRAVARHASMWPGTPLLLAVPDPAVAALLRPGSGRVAVFTSVESALDAEPRRRIPAVRDRLLPMTGAPRRARDITLAACHRWGLTHLAGRAGLVAGELVTNAVVHAGTMMDLRLSLGRRYLVVAVRDGSTEVPVLPVNMSADSGAPRGLLLVNAMTQRWGSLPAPDGKVVWATLPHAR